jgi:protein associated with RNAse G/E
MKKIKIIKQDYSGSNVWEYSGNLLERNGNKVIISAHFDRENTIVDKLILKPRDKFIETYYLDKWYNIYEIHDRENNSVKAWYCNISFPAEISGDTLNFKDLELDLLIYPDGSQKVLDIDEFNALPLTEELRTSALKALSELEAIFSSSEFDY